MIEIKLKRIIVISILTLTFLMGSALGVNPQVFRGRENKISVVYAAPKGSSGGFKSGVFKSKGSSSGGFKSGGFFNTKPKTTSPFGGSSYKTTKRSFLPIPIPIPRYRNYNYYGAGGFIFGIFRFFWSIIKIIIIISIILWVIKRSKRR